MNNMKSVISALLSASLLVPYPATAQSVIFRYNTGALDAPGLALGQLLVSDLYVGEAVNIRAAGTGGIGPLTWSSIGSLPSGLSFGADGVLSGSPAVAGSYSITMKATDSVGDEASGSVNIHVYENLAAGTLFDVLALNASESKNLPTTGGKSPISFSLNSGSLPPGINVSGSRISGTPSQLGTYTSKIRARDANGKTADVDVELSVFDNLYITSNFPDAYVGEAYSGSFTAGGGSGVYTWTDGGNWPPEISFTDGTVSGVFATTGAYSVTTTVSDGFDFADGSATINSYAIPALSTKAYADPYIATTYATVFGAAPTLTGGKSPFLWSASGLPPGMVINPSNGSISGTPTVAGNSTATITATDSNGKPTSGSYNFETRAQLSLAAKTYADPYVGTAYTAAEGSAPSASGGKSPYQWSATGLPSGLSIAPSTGVISGTPSASTATTASVTISDANAVSISRSYAFTPRAALVATNSLPSTIKTATPVDVMMSATGGKSPYTFTVTGLPTGLSMTTAGRLTGSTSATGTFNTAVTVTDANGKTNTASKPIVSEKNEIVVSMTGGNGAITLKSLFDLADWNSDTPKVVNLASGQIRGSTSATTVVTMGGNWGGTLTFNVAGEIQGKAGAANSGAGGNALQAEVLGNSGQKLILNVTGAMRGGGGGGGKGGTGGKGGAGSTSTTVSEEQYTKQKTQYYHGMESQGHIIWNDTVIFNGTMQWGKTVTVGGYTYGPGTIKEPGIPAPHMIPPKPQYAAVIRSGTTTTATTGGNGGAGGNGGIGQGYTVTAANGVAGVAGSAGGTNAGAGGTGGTGGKGSAWATAGSTGGTGATGAKGTSNGVAGSAGVAGGAAGFGIVGLANITLSNSGTVNGSK